MNASIFSLSWLSIVRLSQTVVLLETRTLWAHTSRTCYALSYPHVDTVQARKTLIYTLFLSSVSLYIVLTFMTINPHTSITLIIISRILDESNLQQNN